MTICTSSIPHPPPIPSSTRGSTKGFRLMDPSLNDPVETGSVYSIYKQKIDSMFESDSSGASNTVQARIERMFTEVAKDEGLPPKIDPGCHGFSVDYLGSVPLQGKVTSLAGLQVNLRLGAPGDGTVGSWGVKKSLRWLVRLGDNLMFSCCMKKIMLAIFTKKKMQRFVTCS